MRGLVVLALHAVAHPHSDPASGDKVGSISDNHGHSAVIAGAKLTAGAAISLDIQGTATHTHTVDLSAAEIASIAGEPARVEVVQHG